VDDVETEKVVCFTNHGVGACNEVVNTLKEKAIPCQGEKWYFSTVTTQFVCMIVVCNKSSLTINYIVGIVNSRGVMNLNFDFIVFPSTVQTPLQPT